MSEWLQKLISAHRQRGLLVDTNILLLRAIGLHDPAMIQKFKRTQQFTPGDFGLLNWFWGQFVRVVTTPHILTEVSNLCGQLPETIRTTFLTGWRDQIGILDEIYVPSRELAGSPVFTRFGLTDTAINQLAAEGLLILTDDFRLAGSLELRRLAVVNFNHIRSLAD